MVGTDCSCCGDMESRCGWCDPGTDPPFNLQLAVSGVSTTMDADDYTNTHNPPGFPWDDDYGRPEIWPADIDDANSTITLSNLEGFSTPCRWQGALMGWWKNIFTPVTINASFWLERGPVSVGGASIGTSDQLLAVLHFPGIIAMWKVAATGMDTDPAVDCASLFPFTFSNADNVEEFESAPGISDEIPDLRTATAVVSIP